MKYLALLAVLLTGNAVDIVNSRPAFALAENIPSTTVTRKRTKVGRPGKPVGRNYSPEVFGKHSSGGSAPGFQESRDEAETLEICLDDVAINMTTCNGGHLNTYRGETKGTCANIANETPMSARAVVGGEAGLEGKGIGAIKGKLEIEFGAQSSINTRYDSCKTSAVADIKVGENSCLLAKQKVDKACKIKHAPES